jgi:hypothetical protein
MPVYNQPGPEAWDDEHQGHRDGSDDGSLLMATSDTGSGDEPVAYSSGDAPGLGDVTAVSTDPGAGLANAPEEPGSPSGSSAALGTEADEGSAFLADLARAMQAAAGAERARSLDDTERRREANVAEIRSRSSVDAASLDAQAEAEIAEIGAWAETEMERIREERDRRIQTRRESLERRLEDHRSLVERQVDAVSDAIARYKGDLDRFFDRLEAEQDPSAIARLARTRPAFPALDLVARRARTAATADALGDEPVFPADGSPEEAAARVDEGTGEDSPLIGVMDRSTAVSAPEAPWSSPPPAADAPADVPATEEVAAHSNPAPRSGALLSAVPALRPIGAWLNRERDEENPADRA